MSGDERPEGGAPEWDATIGSVAEETARLLRALGVPDNADPTDAEPGDPGDPVEPDRAHGPAAHTHVPMGSAQTCTWCPVCRGVSLVRELSPETLRSLADVATLAATTLADLAARRHAGPDAAGSGEPTAPPSRPQRPVVEEVRVVAEGSATKAAPRRSGPARTSGGRT